MKTVYSNFSNSGKVFDALQVSVDAQTAAKEAGKVSRQLREGDELVKAIFGERVKGWLGRINHALKLIDSGKANDSNLIDLVAMRNFLAKYNRATK